MKTLVLLRHGESTWNLENRFTGWTDVDLTPKGVAGGARGGPAADGRAATTSTSPSPRVLKRAIRTLWIALDEMDLHVAAGAQDWRLNERHYGALQGLNKAETAAKFGEEQVLVWRRSYDDAAAAARPRTTRATPAHDRRYADAAARAAPAHRVA